MAKIELCALRHSYMRHPVKDDDYALKSVNLTWEEGLAYALLGPSGSGKTTMLNVLSGLLSPSEGWVLFDGRDVTRLEARERNIAQVFQFPVIYETMTVRENLAFPLHTRKVAPAKIRGRVEFIADELGLSDLLDRRARALTAEQKQRISLGRGLVREDVAAILLDEPLTVIDPAEKMALRRTLKSVQQHLGVQVIYVTHDQHEAMTLADRVVVMDEGAVVQVGTPQELFEDPAHRFVGYFIGTPGMNFIPCQLNDNGLQVGTDQFPLQAEALSALRQQLEPLSLGIRPDFLSLAGESDQLIFHGRVERVENHGDEQVVSVSLGDELVMMRVNEHIRLQTGENVRIAPQREALRVFAGQQRVSLPDRVFGGNTHE